MTTFGKILVFVNLVFSLVVCFLIIMVFIARTNWSNAYEQMDRQHQAAVASTNSAQAQLKATISQSEEAVKAADTIREKAVADTKAMQDKLNVADKDLQEANKKVAELTSANTAMEKAVQRRTDEAKKQEEILAKTRELLADTTKEYIKEKDQRVNAEIQKKSVMARAKIIEEKLEEAVKDNLRLKQGPTTVAGKPASNPPPQNVEGLIKNTDTTGLVTLTIGSDSGVQAGHTLEVYRLEPRPLYLGTIRILKSTPTEAVGQPVRAPHAPLQLGDRVSGKIGFGG